MHMQKVAKTTRHNPSKASAAKAAAAKIVRRNPPKAPAATPRGLESRITALETHWQYVATKDDVRDLEKKIRDLDKRMEVGFVQMQVGMYKAAGSVVLAVVVSAVVVMLRQILAG